MSLCGCAELFGEVSFERKVDGGTTEVDLKLRRLGLLPIVVEIVIVPVLADVGVGRGTRDGWFTLFRSAAVMSRADTGRAPVSFVNEEYDDLSSCISLPMAA
jgi:hypothetical protein